MAQLQLKKQTTRVQYNMKLIFNYYVRNTKTSRLVFTAPLHPQGPNAPSLECPPNVVPNSEFRTCADPKFPNTLQSEFMNLPNIEFLNVPLCNAPMLYLAGSKCGHPLCYGNAAVRWCLQCGWGVASILALWR